MLTWHCTTRARHLPHTWFYRKQQQWYRCDGQSLGRLNHDDTVSSDNEGNNQ
jgi:hypothetical protein